MATFTGSRPIAVAQSAEPELVLMAALRRITASEEWAKRSAVIQILFAFDPEVRDRWPEIRDAELQALRQLSETADAERQPEP